MVLKDLQMYVYNVIVFFAYNAKVSHLWTVKSVKMVFAYMTKY